MLDETLHYALAAIGTSLDELRCTATEIVVFGSRAADVACANSDWDLLCVGRGASRATPKIDLVWITPEDLQCERWTGSELAGHVQAWGRWIWGTRTWHAEMSTAPHAVTLKGRRIVARACALELTWDDLSADHRHKHFTLLRRDLARYILLRQGLPVPPTTYIDGMLQVGNVSPTALNEVADHLGIRSLFACLSRSRTSKTHQKQARPRAAVTFAAPFDPLIPSLDPLSRP